MVCKICKLLLLIPLFSLKYFKMHNNKRTFSQANENQQNKRIRSVFDGVNGLSDQARHQFTIHSHLLANNFWSAQSNIQYSQPFLDLSKNSFNSSHHHQIPLSVNNYSTYVASTNYVLKLDGVKERDFVDDVRSWAISNRIPHSSLNDLLEILNYHKKHESLPKDARVLLGTSRDAKKILQLGSGSFLYFGLKEGLEKEISKFGHLPLGPKIILDSNIDGLPWLIVQKIQFGPF